MKGKGTRYPDSVREEAREKRRSGQSVREIAKEMAISRGTISLWVREIELSVEQRRWLNERAGASRRQALVHHGSGRRKAATKARAEARRAGRESNTSMMDAVVVGLYWGEGHKSEGYWAFVNSDPNCIDVITQWLCRWGCKGSRVRVQTHEGTGVTDEQIQDFWSNYLHVPYALKVGRVTKESTGRSKRTRSRPFGTCRVSTRKGMFFYEFIRGQAEALGIDSW